MSEATPIIKKVIRASAGTGKTYRLSLEVIALLIRSRVPISEILVITFTRKATAEIRERIFRHLHDIIAENGEGDELRVSMKELFGLEINEAEIQYLRSVLAQMLSDKSGVRISTIDSFVSGVFRSVVAPFLGLPDYSIDTGRDFAPKPELYASLLGTSEGIDSLAPFLSRSGKRTLDDYDELVRSILEKRWFFDLIEKRGNSGDNRAGRIVDLREKAAALLCRFYGHLSEALERDYGHLAPEKVLRADTLELLDAGRGELCLSGLASSFREWLLDKGFTPDGARALFRLGHPWNGSIAFRGKAHAGTRADLESELEAGQAALADALFEDLLMSEHRDLVQFAKQVLEAYDNVTFRERRFSYSDIAHHTYSTLRHPELSLIDGDEVTNLFYEVLAGTIRFILIDEFQDTSVLQLKILLPIIKEVISGAGSRPYGGVVVVGDEKQAIYGWRGGERDLLLRMPDILKGAEEERLSTCYRSDPAVVEFINSVFCGDDFRAGLEANDLEWPAEPVRAAKSGHEGCVRLYCDEKDAKEAVSRMAEEVILPAIKSGSIAPGRAAVLARRNIDLERLAQVLRGHRIPAVLESSSSILDHRAVAPVYTLMQYLTFGDPYDLLRFLRSDLVFLDGRELEQVVLALGQRERPFWQQCGHIRGISKIVELKQQVEAGGAELLPLGMRLIEAFNVTGIFHGEEDGRNLYAFLRLLARFAASPHDYTLTLKGFIDHCERHRSDEAFRQPGLEESEAIRLHTIHKSKGLEFETVFLFWDLKSRSGSGHGTLRQYLRFDDTYSDLLEAVLTYNLDYILDFGRGRILRERAVKRDGIETLNTLYVALTRACRNLCVYLAGSGADLKPEQRMDHLVVQCMRRQFSGWTELKQGLRSAGAGRWVSQPSEAQQVQQPDLAYLGNCIDSERDSYGTIDRERVEKEAYLNFKTLYLVNRSTDRGNVAHDYLSHFHGAGADERSRASALTSTSFGSLLPAGEIEALIRKVDDFIGRNPGLFDTGRWDRIFTEQTLYHNNRELRIDRIMVDEAAKEILVVDYKTGQVDTERQIEEYVTAVSALPWVREKGFRVRGEYVEVEI